MAGWMAGWLAVRWLFDGWLAGWLAILGRGNGCLSGGPGLFCSGWVDGRRVVCMFVGSGCCGGPLFDSFFIVGFGSAGQAVGGLGLCGVGGGVEWRGGRMW